MKYFLLFFTLLVLPAKFFAQPLNKQLTNSKKIPPGDGKVPDYSSLYYWAAHPDKKDVSDSIPEFLKDAVVEQKADVFFLHYTTYLVGTALNADIDDQELNNRTDASTIYYQASVFNGSCRVFAPRYRQALLKTFFDPDAEDSQEAFQLAYSDIRTAFQYYLDHYNHGRPIIIAGHSQGTFHAIKLLQEFFDGKPLQKQLVCAYLPGFQIKKNAFKSIPLGVSPTQTGCFVGWQSYKKGYVDPVLLIMQGNEQAVNPITWTTASKATDKQQHMGAMAIDFNTLYAQSISARLDNTTKGVNVDMAPDLFSKFFSMDNLHGFDYNLFYMDIRYNVKQRVDAYLTTH